MCGFAGWTGRSCPQADTATLRAMGSVLAHRGPDDERFFDSPMLRLVFRRLAINDLHAGAQPFFADGERIVAVVNGEIYNHRELARCELPDVPLASRSDGEVVAHLYRKLGMRCLDLLNGIFAIALWDRERRTLVLARDRLGVKPLYVARLPGGDVLFASELKALLQHPQAPRALDWPAFGGAPDAAFPFDRPAGRPVPTGVQGVDFVPPASFVQWRHGHLEPPVRYWQAQGPDDTDVAPLQTMDACVDRYAELLDDSVRMQLMSDVPVGLFLSGGLDSCLIAALAARSGRTLDAFTLVEPSIAATGDTAAAGRLARQLGMPLHLLRVDSEALHRTLDLGLSALEHFVWTLDFPMFDIELLFKHELHRHVRQVEPAMKVILLGQGADEFAGGYSSLASNSWQAYVDHEAQRLHGARLKHAGMPPPLCDLIDPARLSSLPHGPAFPEASATRACEPWQALRFDDLPAYNLWHEDRIAASHGTEVRVPFLDHHLVEWLCALPRRWRAALLFDKAIERQAASRVLPRDLTQRPKVPLYGRLAGQGASIRQLRRRLALDAFEGFREAYLGRPDSVFSLRGLQRVHDRAAAPGTGDASDGASQLLLRCMAIGIFERLCREAAQPGFEWPRWPTLGPPLTADGSALAGDPPTDECLRLVPGVELSWSCDADAPALLVIRHHELVARLTLPAAQPTAMVTRRRLQTDAFASALGVEREDVAPLLQRFVEQGWAEPDAVAACLPEAQAQACS